LIQIKRAKENRRRVQKNLLGTVFCPAIGNAGGQLRARHKKSW
jgi:hypothetical protein